MKVIKNESSPMAVLGRWVQNKVISAAVPSHSVSVETVTFAVSEGLNWQCTIMAQGVNNPSYEKKNYSEHK